MPDHVPFKRVVVTGVENSGKTTFAKLLARELHWPMIEEHARRHQAVLNGQVNEDTFDQLHESQTEAAADIARAGHAGVVCDTGDLVLRMWSEQVLGFSWHPLSPPWPSVDLHILCPTLEVWEEDPLRSMPRLEDRLALEAQYRAHLEHRHHLVAEGDTPEARVAHILAQWPW